ncbi:hypothetical protein U1Q18_007640 [Sarracenia purpurea var. burkii]
MPMPSMVTAMATKVNLGWTQWKQLGLNNPNSQPDATHNGNAVMKASATTSIQPRKLPSLLLTPTLFDELLQRNGGNDWTLWVQMGPRNDD